MKNKFLKILGYGFTALVVAVVLIAGTIMFKTFRYPGKVPSVFGYSIMTVLSGSMQPVLMPGDMVGIKEVDTEKIKIGDVVTYQVDEKTYVTHRVKEMVEDNGSIAYKTQGDANNVEDGSLIAKEQIIGTMAFRIPYGGYVAQFIRTPKGFILFIIIPSLILIFSELKTVLSDVKKSKKGNTKAQDNMEL